MKHNMRISNTRVRFQFSDGPLCCGGEHQPFSVLLEVVSPHNITWACNVYLFTVVSVCSNQNWTVLQKWRQLDINIYVIVGFVGRVEEVDVGGKGEKKGVGVGF